MSKRIVIRLKRTEAALALAFQRHCHEVLGITLPLEDLVRRQFIKFLYDNLDPTGGADASDTGNTGGDTAEAGVQPEGDTGVTLDLSEGAPDSGSHTK